MEVDMCFCNICYSFQASYSQCFFQDCFCSFCLIKRFASILHRFKLVRKIQSCIDLKLSNIDKKPHGHYCLLQYTRYKNNSRV